jgi:hypothetical protein
VQLSAPITPATEPGKHGEHEVDFPGLKKPGRHSLQKTKSSLEYERKVPAGQGVQVTETLFNWKPGGQTWMENSVLKLEEYESTTAVTEFWTVWLGAGYIVKVGAKIRENIALSQLLTDWVKNMEFGLKIIGMDGSMDDEISVTLHDAPTAVWPRQS